MSSPRFQIEREPATLKDAESELVKACGGIEKASALTRVRPSQMQRYTAPGEPDCHMPADVIESLELHCGKALVSGYLGLQTNHVMIDISKSDPAEAAMHMAIIGKETGKLYQEFGESIADGTITAKEAAKLRAAAMKDIAALAALCGDLGRVQRGETP